MWKQLSVPFKFQLSDWTLLSIALPLQVRQIRLGDHTDPVAVPQPPSDPCPPANQGFLIRSLPVSGQQPRLRWAGSYFCYVPSQYPHYYIDMGTTSAEYKATVFSSKTRSTLARKINKFQRHCGGTLHWRRYSDPAAMREFFKDGREVSARTYQERLLDAGLPDSEDFLHEMESLASQDRVRAFVLFDGRRPVSYLYCPVVDGNLIYAYLGYDPDYQKLSVGTVLQSLALDSLFAERRFRYFDFTEGEADHKRLFASHSIPAANVFFVRRSLRNALLIYGHMGFSRMSAALGAGIERAGLKSRIRNLLRFGPTTGGEARALIARAQSAWRRHGPAGMPRLLGKNLYFFLGQLLTGRVFRRARHEDSEFDQTFGTDTAGIREVGSLDIDSANARHAVRYQPSPHELVRKIIHGLPLDHRLFTFVDFGAGKGRVLLIAAELPFAAVLGIEFSRILCEVAATNIARMDPGKRAAARVDCLYSDVTAFAFPADPLVCYFYNPFDATIMGSVVDRLTASLAAGPREVWIVYVHPEHRSLFDASGIWDLVAQGPFHVVYRTRRPQAGVQTS